MKSFSWPLLALTLLSLIGALIMSNDVAELHNTLDIETILYERQINELQDENIELRYELFEVTQDSFWINSIYEDTNNDTN